MPQLHQTLVVSSGFVASSLRALYATPTHSIAIRCAMRIHAHRVTSFDHHYRYVDGGSLTGNPASTQCRPTC